MTQPTDQQRDGWSSRLREVLIDMGFWKTERRPGFRELARKLDQKGVGQIPRIVNWRDTTTPVSLTHALASKISAVSGFRTAYLLDGELPRKDAEQNPDHRVLELFERMHSPVTPGIMSEFARMKMRARLRTASSLNTFADEVALPRLSVLSVWEGNSMTENNVDAWLKRLHADPVAVNAWWAKGGRVLSQTLDLLARDPSARGRGIRDAQSKGAGPAAILAVLENDVLPADADEGSWSRTVLLTHDRIERAVQDARSTQTALRRKGGKKPKAKTPAKQPRSQRAPRSVRKKAADE